MVNNIKHIYCNTFRINYWVSYGVSEKKFIKSVKKIFDKNFNHELRSGFCGVFHTSTGEDIYWIWTKNKDIPVLVHECLHAVGESLSRRGVKFYPEEDEVYSYQLEMLMRETLREK